MGTQSCKGCYDLTERNAFDAQYSTAHEGFQLLCRCCGLLLIIDIRCGWSCQQITVYGRADQNTLSHPGRKLENGMADQISRLFIKQTVIAFSGSNVKLLFTYFIVDRIRIYACRVYHTGCFDIPLVCLDPISLCCFLNVLYLSQKAEFHTVVAGILCQGNRQAKRADNAAAWYIQRGNHGILNIRFHFTRLISADDRHTFHAILHAFFIKCLQRRFVFFRKAQHQGTIALVFKIQFFRELFHHPASLNVEFCL